VQRRVGILARIALSLGSVICASSAPTGAEEVQYGQESTRVEGPLQRIRQALEAKRELEIKGQKQEVRGFDYFANIPPGSIGVEAIPLVLFRLLPDLAERLGDRDPEFPDRPLFGAPAQNFAKFGFLSPPDRKLKAVPLGFSWTQPTPAMPLSIAARTCAGCHVGRVRTDDEKGTIQWIWGGANTEILLHQYDAAITGFFQKHLSRPDARQRLKAEIRTLLAEKQRESTTWFFQNADGYPEGQEQFQVEPLKTDDVLDKTLALIDTINTLRVAPRQLLHDVAYSKPNSPPIDAGPPGYIDSSGLGIAAFVTDRADLFPGATKNDVPSVWNQKTRKLFQWDVNIRDTVTRNMVASLGLIGQAEKLDITANYIISDFIDNLPPAPYPFRIDQAAALNGQAVYERNCAVCHREDQNRGGSREDDPPVYLMGTDTNRARVVTPGGFLAIRQVLVDGHQPRNLVFRYGLPGHTTEVRPTVIDPDSLLVDRTAVKDQGYVANPLDGIWARAPYLHNGSVPTLRHLLVPKLRPGASVFVRGIISYDQKNVGWVWDRAQLAKYQARDLSARLYDTTLDGQSSKGHDRKWIKIRIKVAPKGQGHAARFEERNCQLTWDNENDPEVNNLLEYLKTL
jgi:mono/diheme cytochrome c family protein